MEVIGRGSVTIVDGVRLRDRRLGGPRPPAADDQQRRPALAAGRLPVRPAAPPPGRDPGPARAAGRRGRLELADRSATVTARRPRRTRARTAAPGRPTRPKARPARPARPPAAGRRPAREPTLRDPRDPGPARPELLGARAGRPDARRPRRPRGVPVEHDPGLHRGASSSSCRRSRTTPARSAGAAGSSPGCARAPGPATSPSTSRSSSRTSPAPTSATARPARPGEYGQYNVIYEYREEQVGIEAGKIAVALVNHLVAPDDAASPSTSSPSSSGSSGSPSGRRSGRRPRRSSTRRVSRDIPYIRLDRHSLVQLGQGVHQQRIRATMTSRTCGDRGRHRVATRA